MSALRKAARGEACQVRLPGCEYGSETVSLAHIRRPWNAGVGTKPSDLHGAFACASCHAALDRREGYLTQAEIDAAFLDAHLRTLDIWKERGLI